MTTTAPLSVALVKDTLERGGAERVLVEIANGLDPERFRVHVICTRYPGSLAADLAPHVELHSLERRSRLDIDALRRFSRVVSEHGIRIIHTHNHSAAYFARMARYLDRARWIHVMHDHHGPVEGSPLLRLADRLLLRNVDYYLAVSSRLESYAGRSIGIPAQRRECLINGVHVPAAATPPPGGPFTVAHVARIASEKNQKMALDVVQAMRESLPTVRWLLVGRATSPYAAECARLVEERGLSDSIVFLGELTVVGDALASAHAGVVTSTFEGLPIALLEYMAVGLPVVVTDVGECAAVVRASGGGTVVAPGDVDAFARALIHYATDPDAAALAGAANRRYVVAHHDNAAMVRRIAEVYEALLDPDQKATSYSRSAAGSV